MSNWFSNFLPFEDPLVFRGITYRTPENFYQAMKTTDVAEHLAISKMTPSQAKRRGRAIAVRSDWEDIKVRVMDYALRHKFTRDTEAGRRLMQEKGDIVEHNTWHDNYWGICMCSGLTSSPYGVRNCLNGQNVLGRLLMKIRQDLLQEDS